MSLQAIDESLEIVEMFRRHPDADEVLRILDGSGKKGTVKGDKSLDVEIKGGGRIFFDPDEDEIVVQLKKSEASLGMELVKKLGQTSRMPMYLDATL